jgi:NhaP-type Na+/H+ or K+/H+ antiporter
VTTISRSPFTSAIVYLCVGILLGPSFFSIFRFEPWKQSALLEMLTQVTLLISLFSAGIKMPVPFKLARWDAPLRLAWISMTLTVGLVALFAWYVLHLPAGAAMLGGILAPTDPVLATDVQVRHPGDKDQLRFTLTCRSRHERRQRLPVRAAGSCHAGYRRHGQHHLRWLLVDVIWGTAGAVAVGAVRRGTGAPGWRLRIVEPRHDIMDDLVGLGLIAVVFAVASMIKASGYLAVFFAAVALRQTELVLAGAPRDRHGCWSQTSPNPKSRKQADDSRHSP